LLPGDSANLETPGGGGFGNPAEREIEAVLDDVRQGYVSTSEAAKLYGEALGAAPVSALGAVPNTTSDQGDDQA
jgi:N-methylhydantoinase B